MTLLSVSDLERGFHQLLTLTRSNPALEAELASSVADFFGDTQGEIPVDGLLNARRHQEWFLFERHSAHLGGVPCERLLGEWRAAMGDDQGDEIERSLLDSKAGVFSVRQVAEDGAAWLEDLGGLQEHSLRPNPEAPPLESGDLVIGRVHPDGEGAVLASPAAGVFRSPDLHQAIESDLAQRRSGGGPTLLKFDQLALERGFFQTMATQDEDSPGDIDPIVVAEDFLLSAGCAQNTVRDIFTRLRSTPLQPHGLALGAGDELSEVLDDLAFETEADLTQARALIGAAWHALRLDTKQPKAPTHGKTEALKHFDKGRTDGRDVQSLLDNLERDLGLNQNTEGLPETSPAPMPVGITKALVMEFRWEVQGTSDIQLSTQQLEALDLLIEFGSGFEQPEELGSQAMRQFLFFWSCEHRVKPTLIKELIPALDAFCSWATAEQDLEVADWKPTNENWIGELERTLQINQVLPKDPESDGDLFEVLAGQDPKGLPGVMVSSLGGVPFRTEASCEALRQVQEGDLVRAKLLDGECLAVRSIYPGCARELGE